MAEQFRVVQQTSFYRLAQQSVERAQIAADAVLLQSLVSKPSLVTLYHIGCKFIECQIHILTESLKTSIGISVCTGRALSPHLFFLGDLLLQEHKYCLICLFLAEDFAQFFYCKFLVATLQPVKDRLPTL